MSVSSTAAKPSVAIKVQPAAGDAFDVAIAERRDCYIIGRKAVFGGKNDLDIALPDRQVSRRHCALEFKEGRWMIRDLQSRNGVIVDGHSITLPTDLQQGMTILLGSTSLTIEGLADPEIMEDSTLEIREEADEQEAHQSEEVGKKNFVSQLRAKKRAAEDRTILRDPTLMLDEEAEDEMDEPTINITDEEAQDIVMSSDSPPLEKIDVSKASLASFSNEPGIESTIPEAASEADLTISEPVADEDATIAEVDSEEDLTLNQALTDADVTTTDASPEEDMTIRDTASEDDVTITDTSSEDLTISQPNVEEDVPLVDGRGEQDATLISNDDDQDTIVVAPEDETAVAAAEEEDATVLTAAEEEDATVLTASEEDATVLTAAEEEDTTVLTAAEEDATVLTAAEEEDATVLTAAEEEDATVLTATEEEDATVVSASDEAATVVQSQASEPGDIGADDAPTVVNGNGTVSDTAPAPQPSLSMIQRMAGVENDEEAGAETSVKRTDPQFDTGEFNEYTIELLENGLISMDMAANALSRSKRNGTTFFRELVSSKDLSSKDKVLQYTANKLDVEMLTERGIVENLSFKKFLKPESAEVIGILPLSSEQENVFHYGTVDPFDIRQQDWIERNTDENTMFSLLTPEAFASGLSRLASQSDQRDGSEFGLAVDINLDSSQEAVIRDQMATGDADIPSLVNYFLHRAFIQGASDIHIEPTEKLLLVRNRVDGMLHEDSEVPTELHRAVTSRLKIMAGLDVAEKRRPQDGRIGVTIRGSSIDVRVSTFPTVWGEKTVMRLLDKNALRPSPDHLGLLPRDLRALLDKINAPFGLVMISGPTGSGKTTTLYSCLQAIDKTEKNVLTIEDPVEYRLKGVHQLQVNEKIGLTFASGLRTVLRQDPDVVMVGECRDVETSGMAIQASLTGHIVFSTIHTNDAIGVVTRLLDMGIDPFLVANALTLAIAQRLVRTSCRMCQQGVPGQTILQELHSDGVSTERLERLNIYIDPDMEYVRGAGCSHCHGTGYQGRRAVFEIFEMTSAARNMIMSDNFNADMLRKHTEELGMTTLITHGLTLVEEGVTTHQEVIRVLGETY